MQTATLQSLNKVWIPESYNFNPESVIAQYISSRNLPASKTLRFAQVEGKAFNELLIPRDIVKEADEYDIFAECYANLNDLREGMKEGNMVTPGATVDYNTATFAGPKPAS
jgi:hypothetical protein